MKTIVKIFGLALLYLFIVYLLIKISFSVFDSKTNTAELSSTLWFQLIVYFLPLVIVILIGKRILKK